MHFWFTEEHEMLRQTVRDFAEREIRPRIRELDEKEHFDREILEKMAEMGFLGVCLPVRYGGAGMDYISLGIVSEMLEWGDTAFRETISVHVALNSLAIFQWGTEEQKQRWLVPQARGEKIAAYALTEPNAGSDVASMRTRAVRQGDVYILNGEKMWITLADVADHFLVFAKTDPEAGHRGITAFIVERGMPGVKTGTIRGKMGARASNTGWIVFEDTPVPVENRLGEEGEGFKIAMSALDNGRYTVAAGACGVIRACLEESIAYAKQRTAFGRPIAEFQLIQQMIANMQQRLEIATLLTYRVGWMKNQGIRNTRETSLAKWYATEAALASANEAIQIHGAYGYVNEYNVERYLRNAKGAVIYEGTSQIHTLIQAQYALGYRKDKPLRCELPPYDPDAWTREA